MKLRTLILAEIRHRWISFLGGCLSVTVAIACLVAVVTLLRMQDTRAERVLAEREQETRREMERLEDDYRRIMRDLGHNVLVIHRDQPLAELQRLGHPQVMMPESHARRLAEGGTRTLNHLLPVLQQRVRWPEQNLDVLLCGTPGQLPVLGREGFLTTDGLRYRNPIIPTIPAGQAHIGHGLAAQLGLGTGDHLRFMGQDLVVTRVLPQEGGPGDIAIWTDLAQVQDWLDLDGQINGILGLECICQVDALGRITADVQRILPDVQVLEFASRVRARALARQRAEEANRTALATEQAHQERMAQERRILAAVLIPLALAAATAWVFLLVHGNVRDRRSEIGILRALGLGQGRIMAIVLGKAVVMGAIAAVAGCLLGLMTIMLWGGLPLDDPAFWQHIDVTLLLAALLLAPALCALAAWLPALRAATHDPADMLREAA